MFATAIFFPDITPTVPSPFQSSTSIPVSTDLHVNGAGGLVIGITVTIAAMVVVVVMMVVVSSLIAYFLFRKRKRNHSITDSKVFLCVCLHLCMTSSLSACKYRFCASLYWHVFVVCEFVCVSAPVCVCVCVHACICALPGRL